MISGIPYKQPPHLKCVYYIIYFIKCVDQDLSSTVDERRKQCWANQVLKAVCSA